MSPKSLAAGLLPSAALLVGMGSAPSLAGTLTTLYSFTNGADGAFPSGGVTADAVGTLYGETYQAGDFACKATTGSPHQGCGIIYSFSQAGGLKVLTTFNGPNGAYGNSGLTLIGAKLYGATYGGGISGDGVIFSINTDGSNYSLLHQFSGSDGVNPIGTLRLGVGNIIYGVTGGGGPTGNGVLFSLAPDGTYSILHAFAGAGDGSSPNALLIAPNGTLVGSAGAGGNVSPVGCITVCGTVFTYVPASGKFAVQYALSPTTGYRPFVGSLGPGPTIYGGMQVGTFALSQKGGFTISNGPYLSSTFYSGPAYLPGGTLIGDSSGGYIAGFGELYTVIAGEGNFLYTFTGKKDGANPRAQPFVTPAGDYIGTTTQKGQCSNCGTIWQYTP